MAKPKYWYIKERQNPQTGTYYVLLGNIGKADAMKQEKAAYGVNFIHQYNSEDEYKAQIEKLKSEGNSIH